MYRPLQVAIAAKAALVALALGLTLAACGDSATETAAETTADTTADTTETADTTDHHSTDHEHTLYEVPDGVPVPSIQIEVEPDPVSGVNVYLDVTDFDIAPEHASTEAVAGEGHFHVYVDGQKVARLYNQSIHLPLTEGDHLVMVELSANDHSIYAVDGVLISDHTEIAVPAPAEGHQHHEGIEATDPAPSLDLTVAPDPMSGWNLHAAVENLVFAPRSAGLDPVDGEGHLHLYVDGEKVARLYGAWWHLDPLTAGGHEITVEATANDHSPYVIDGEPITASVTIDVTPDQAAEAMSDDHAGDDSAEHDHDMPMDESTAGLDVAVMEADTVIEIDVADGSVDRDDTRFVVEEGSTVGLIVTTDVVDHVHVHGYDLLAMTGPGDPAELVFTADSAGVFEVELEDSGVFLFDLQVG